MKSIIKFFTDFFKQDDESKTERIMEERSQLKIQMTENLKNLNFTTVETNEVLNLISDAERKIENLKIRLVGSNINNDPTEKQERTLREIKNIQMQLQADLRNKVQEIQQRKLS